MIPVPRLLLLALLVAQISPQSCSSSGSSSSSSGSGGAVNNVLSVTVNGGPLSYPNNYPDGLFTAVTICVPNTTTCQTISGILVDTGSTGLRILDSALTLSLPQQNAPNGSGSLAECVQYLDGTFTWGPVQTADIKLAGEAANAAAIQVIGENRVGVPQACALGGTANDTVSTLGANGILGVGLFREDCGSACSVTGIQNPGMYFACPSSASCAVTTVANAQQLQNPVALFTGSDNNGVLIQLPSVALGGAATVTGSMIFGIGTQSNNSLGSATVQTSDGFGNFTTIFGGRSYSESFIDSGSNGLFFLDTPSTGLPTCADYPSFYCPGRTQQFSATNRGANGATASVTFNIGNADQLNGAFNAFQELGGPQSGSFDWGLPFFFGRNVFVAIEGQSAPGGTPPYWAY